MLRYALPALAAAGSVLAQSSSCSNSKTFTITNQADAGQIAACTTYTGNVAVATQASGPLMINSVRRIRGDFVVKNAPNVTSLSGDSISQIDGTWTLGNVQTLDTLTFGFLTAVGKIDWSGLPNLNALDFAAQIQQTDSFNLQNTMLPNLNGINLAQCSNFYLANNGQLQEFSMQLQNVTGLIVVQSNGNRMNVTFPNLQWAENITISNVPSISMPSLYAVNGSLGFVENEELTSLSLPNLTRVDGSLSINTNPKLTNYTVPKLTQVKGAVNVQNNTILKVVTFPVLSQVGGAFDAYGNFSNITLPKITDVKGAFNVQSTKDISADCNTFDSEHGENEALKGDYECKGNLNKPTSTTNSNDDGSSTDSSSSSSSSSHNAAPMAMPAMQLTGVLGVVAAMMGML